MPKSDGSIPKFKINVQKLTRGFYFASAAAVVISALIIYAVMSMWAKVAVVKDGSIPQLVETQYTVISIDGTAMMLEKYFDAQTQGAKVVLLDALSETNDIFKKDVDKLMVLMDDEEDREIKEKIMAATKDYLSMFASGHPNPSEAFPKLQRLKISLAELREFVLTKIDRDLKAAEAAKNRALIIIIALSVISVIGMFFTTAVLAGFISRPITDVAGKLVKNSRTIGYVSMELMDGVKAQTSRVAAADKSLDEMINGIIRGDMAKSVEKQAEISAAFSEFLRQFVERTSAEIAMGMMSVAEQSMAVRKNVAAFLKEMTDIERNIKLQSGAVEAIIGELKKMRASNEIISGMDVMEKEAVKLLALVGTSVESVNKQIKLGISVDEALGDSAAIIDSVSEHTKEASDAARKINDMMDDLRETVTNIRGGTGLLEKRSSEVAALFASITEQVNSNMDGARKLEDVAVAIKEVTGRLSVIVRGEDVMADAGDKQNEVTR
ncbi:MAG: hypothetical protein OEV59_05125 [Deltaproteobacteria bacterium]|nr:hypothetical protein [Deltaproteobacteria bacterium]